MVWILWETNSEVGISMQTKDNSWGRLNCVILTTNSERLTNVLASPLPRPQSLMRVMNW